MKSRMFINGMVALVLSLTVVSGCAQNGRNLGVNIRGGQNPQSVIYTKHGRISGQAVNYKISGKGYRFDTSANRQSEHTRQYYMHRSENGDLNRPMNDMIPNDTNPNNPNTSYNTNNQNQQLTPQAPSNMNQNQATPNAPNNTNQKQAAPSTPKAPPTKTPADSSIQKVVKLVNQQRQKHGLSALKVDNSLTNMAQKKAKDMLDNHYFSHTSPTYGSPFDMMKKLGITYTSAGENIAQGQNTAQKVMTDWMNSPGHRANILNKNFTYIGVGHSSSQNYWVQEFIKK